jgi:hypothetical protein
MSGSKNANQDTRLRHPRLGFQLHTPSAGAEQLRFIARAPGMNRNTSRRISRDSRSASNSPSGNVKVAHGSRAAG